MIHNEREYEHTRCQAAELERVLDNWPAAPPPDVLPGVWEMARRGAAWRLDDMRAELRAYAPSACATVQVSVGVVAFPAISDSFWLSAYRHHNESIQDLSRCRWPHHRESEQLSPVHPEVPHVPEEAQGSSHTSGSHGPRQGPLGG